MTELHDFLGKQFDAVYDRTKTIQKAIDETVEYLEERKPEQPSVERKYPRLPIELHCSCEEQRGDDPECAKHKQEPQQKPKCACRPCHHYGDIVDPPLNMAPCPCDCHQPKPKCDRCKFEYTFTNDGPCGCECHGEKDRYPCCDHPYRSGSPCPVHKLPECEACVDKRIAKCVACRQCDQCCECHLKVPGDPSPQPQKEEKDFYTKDEVNEKLKTVLSICEKRGGMHDTLNEIIYVDVKKEREWRTKIEKRLSDLENEK